MQCSKLKTGRLTGCGRRRPAVVRRLSYGWGRRAAMVGPGPPGLAGDLQGVDPDRLPPAEFAARAVEFPVVGAAEQDRELIADFAAERPNLGEAQVMRVAGFTPADEAGSRSHEF